MLSLSVNSSSVIAARALSISDRYCSFLGFISGISGVEITSQVPVNSTPFSTPHFTWFVYVPPYIVLISSSRIIVVCPSRAFLPDGVRASNISCVCVLSVGLTYVTKFPDIVTFFPSPLYTSREEDFDPVGIHFVKSI